MKMTKYFALVLIMMAGQAMASPHVDIDHGHHGGTWQIRTDAQRLIHAERSLLSTIRDSGAAYSHAARDARRLINKTVRLKNSAHHARNVHGLRIQMQSIKHQFRHIRNAISRTHRLQHSRLVRFKVRQVAIKIRKLSNDVHHDQRVVHW